MASIVVVVRSVLLSTFLFHTTDSFSFIARFIQKNPHQEQQHQQREQVPEALLHTTDSFISIARRHHLEQHQQREQAPLADTTWRRLVVTGLSTVLGASTIVLSPTIGPESSVAHAAQQVVVSPDDINRLRRGLQEINYLLDHWDEKTTYCNYGQFKNELLSAANKDKLLEAAKEPILLYDKSATMNVMCKKDPEVVRAFLGLTKENLVLSQADILMKKASTVDLVDPDDIV